MWRKFSILFLVSIFLFAGCIQDEPLNMEADILEFTVPDMPEGIRFGAERVVASKNSNRINIWVTDISKVAMLSPEFVLTPGATIYPKSGTTMDFSDQQEHKYIVTSEDGRWTREYTVAVRLRYVLTADVGGDGRTRTFDFENFQIFEGNANFHEFYELSSENQKLFLWGSGNIGFAIANSNAPAERYPTFSIANGRTDSALKLVTRSTGAFGEMIGMPIAAGNLFLGNFEVAQATSRPMEATRFGITHMMGEPLELNFWYKFQGGTFEDRDGNLRQDYPSIYAVLFEPEVVNGEFIQLNGANVLTASNIISVARLQPEDVVHSTDIENAEFTFGSVRFEARQEIDPEKLASGRYFITIVFSSSSRGQYFEGFVGSTLIIDDVSLITK